MGKLSWSRTFEITENVFNTANHILIGFITIYMTYVCSQTTMGNRTLHVLLCTIGYQLLMAEGILALTPGNVWSYLVSRRTKTLLHWVLQVIGGGCSLAGIYMEYEHRTRHLNNLHERLGFYSMIFMLITIVNGFSNLYAQEMAKWIKPVYQRFLHNLLGLVAFFLGMVSIFYSYEFRWVKNLVPNEMRLTLKYMTLVTLSLTVIGAFRSGYIQMKQIASKN